MPIEKMKEIINFIHNADINLDTPLTVKEDDKVRDALGIINIWYVVVLLFLKN